MGTSSSRGGPMDKSKLLPSWARPDEPNNGGDEGAEPSPEDETPPPELDATEPPAIDQIDIPATAWQTAKGSLTRAARASGDERSYKIRTAAQRYVQAKGGARKASAAATGGSRAASNVGQFVASVARDGLRGALEGLNLAGLAGSDADTVFAAIADALAPPGSTVEEAAARDAVLEALVGLYEKVEAAGGDISALDSLGPEDVREAIEASTTEYIYAKWVGELGQKIERGAISEAMAVSLEREMKTYVRENVRLELKNVDPTRVNWSGEGRAIIQRVFDNAYEFLEGGL